MCIIAVKLPGKFIDLLHILIAGMNVAKYMHA